MKVTQHIENANGKSLFSFEILPPLKGQNIQSIFDSIDPLMEFNPPFIDVTYHREEYEFKELPSGLLQKKIVKKRPGTVGICACPIYGRSSHYQGGIGCQYCLGCMSLRAIPRMELSCARECRLSVRAISIHG